ncbi:MAG: PilZ domain-containing protein [Magnetococcales bacterium]|nr:PilZ domain-containing protein [Magnetococcales bacterium]MBF0322201.1 PilZ domain-containing protein [Magnetococcales bacterium]
MAESDDDDVTLVHARGVHSPDKQGQGEERRRFPRPHFRSPSILSMASGAILKGTTQDVSYRGIRFQPASSSKPSLAVAKGDPGVVRISLNPLLPINACFVDIHCVVVRAEEDFLALQIQHAPVKTPTDQSFPKVFVRRSSGTLEPGWEILPQDATLPEDVLRRMRKHEKKYAEHGPVAVVCRKRGGKPEDDLYKLHNIQYLKEIQEFATRDHDPAKVYDPPTGWS